MSSIDEELEQLKRQMGLNNAQNSADVTQAQAPTDFMSQESGEDVKASSLEMQEGVSNVMSSSLKMQDETTPTLVDSYGLVLAGGGGKGAYEIGAMTALSELDILQKVTMMSANSIGSVNMVLYEGGSLATAKLLWESIRPEDFLEFDENGFDISKEGDGIFSREGLRRLITNNADLNRISGSDKALYLTVCQKTPNGEIQPVYVKLNGKPKEEILNYVMASSAIPIVYDAVTIGDNAYFDGGLCDNTPIQPLYDAGAKDIIVISLDHDYKEQSIRFPNATLYNIIPSQDLDMDSISGTIDLSRSRSVYRYHLGYLDAKAIMQAYLNHTPVPDLSSHHMLAMQECNHAKLKNRIEGEFSAMKNLLERYGIED